MDYTGATFQPKVILMAGDTHGNIDQIKYLVGIAGENDCNAILQLGDFQLADDGISWSETGEWPEAEKVLNTADLPLFFVEGNHDNANYLKDIGAWGANHMTAVSPHIIYLPRGLIWEWNGWSFLAMGGAHSSDRDKRIIGLSWWPEETISYADMDRAAANLHSRKNGVDIMISHDCARGAEPLEATLLTMNKKEDHASKAHRTALKMIADEATPKICFHGHFHMYIPGKLVLSDECTIADVIGLSRDGTGTDSWMVLELG